MLCESHVVLCESCVVWVMCCVTHMLSCVSHVLCESHVVWVTCCVSHMLCESRVVWVMFCATIWHSPHCGTSQIYSKLISSTQCGEDSKPETMVPSKAGFDPLNPVFVSAVFLPHVYSTGERLGTVEIHVFKQFNKNTFNATSVNTASPSYCNSHSGNHCTWVTVQAVFTLGDAWSFSWRPRQILTFASNGGILTSAQIWPRVTQCENALTGAGISVCQRACTLSRRQRPTAASSNKIDVSYWVLTLRSTQYWH